MRRWAFILTSGLSIAACASVPMNMDFSESIRPVHQQSGSDVTTHFALLNANEAYQQERYEESFEAYQLIALKDPENVHARIGWGNSAIALGLFEKAHEIFSHEEGLDTAHDDQKYDHLAGLAIAEVATGRADDEEVRLNAALEYNIEDTRLWHALGQYHDRQGHWRTARKTYLKALWADPKAGPSVANNFGMSLLKEGRYDIALGKFEDAMSMRDDRELYDNNRRLTLALMQDYKQATYKISDERAADIFNDAGYIALTQKKYKVATALLTRSVNVSASYNAEAVQNLEHIKAINSPLKNVPLIATSHSDWGELLP